MEDICDHLRSSGGEYSKDIEKGVIIHKDECLLCFDRPETSKNGIDVCLKCFQSFSRGAIDHTARHFRGTGHVFYLNIVKTLKEKKEDLGKPVKIAKLELQESNFDDSFDTSYSLFCIGCNRSFIESSVPQNLRVLMDGVINSTSSSKSEEIKSWEYERVPCHHCFDFESIPKENSYPHSCSVCELQENLWLCLHCGSLGCGRQQFGSTIAGNSHALKHFEDTKHPLAVKLGSLSRDESSCDVYCYSCNEEVTVPGLGMHLLKFGINLEAAVATEKNLVELNIDQNTNFQFRLDGENGEMLTPLFGPGFTGLQNLGNSCYLNSVVQCLFGFPKYKDYFNVEFPATEVVKNPSEDLLTQLIKLNDGLNSGRYSVENQFEDSIYQTGIRPSYFKNLIGRTHEEFRTNKQQDAFEFLLYLWDKLDNEFGLELNKSFKFLMGSKVVCKQCHKGSFNYDLIDNISVPIEEVIVGKDEETGKDIYKNTTLTDSLRDSFKPEEIEGFQCDNCNKKTTGVKSSWLKTFPKYLAVNVNRIKLKDFVPYKSTVPISHQEHLDLHKFGTPTSDPEEQLVEKTQESDNSFKPNANAMEALLSMGFPEVRCLKGLYHTGNEDTESAMNWLFTHMDDPDIDAPFSISEEYSNGPSADDLNNLLAMGFNENLAKKALLLNSNDMNASVEWLFSNPNDDGIITDTNTPVINLTLENSNLKKSLLANEITSEAHYELNSVICHKGSSPHTGHYVAYIKKNVNGISQWTLFNDEKVVQCDQKSLDNTAETSYIYFFEKR